MNARRARLQPLEVDAETSARLGRIRQRDTSAELIVRRIVHAQGHGFRVQTRDLPGSPDLANRSRRWAIFVQGCFWHHHEGCYRATTPKRNRAFWMAKFEANRARDDRAQRALRELGYRIVVVWECETDDLERLARRLRRALAHTCPNRDS